MAVSVIGSYRLQQDDLPVSLKGYWRYQPGDDSVWASRGYDDSRWMLRRSVSFAAAKDTAKTGSAAVAWFRLRVIIDSGLAGKPLAITMTKSAKADVFIDGRPISSSAEAPQSMAEDSVIPVKRPMLFTLDKPGTHLIAVRLENTGAVPSGGSPGSQSLTIRLPDTTVMWPEMRPAFTFT